MKCFAKASRFHGMSAKMFPCSSLRALQIESFTIIIAIHSDGHPLNYCCYRFNSFVAIVVVSPPPESFNFGRRCVCVCVFTLKLGSDTIRKVLVVIKLKEWSCKESAKLKCTCLCGCQAWWVYALTGWRKCEKTFVICSRVRSDIFDFHRTSNDTTRNRIEKEINVEQLIDMVNTS